MGTWFDTGSLGTPAMPSSGMIPSIPRWAERATMTKAKLDCFEPNDKGDGSAPGKKIDKLSMDFQFNPTDLTLAKSADWSATTAKSGQTGPVEFQGAKPSTLTLKMFLDASADQGNSVVDSLEKLAAACVPTDQSGSKKKPNPPWVQFSWGATKSFVGYISSVSAQITMFTPTGTPLRATATVTLNELPKKTKGQNPTSGTKEPRRLHVTDEGDSLAGLAFSEYGDPSMWRVIADVNGIDDPMRMRAGTRLLIPNEIELLDLIHRPEPKALLANEPTRA